MTFFGGRTIFGHNHESIGAQPMNELVRLLFSSPSPHGSRETLPPAPLHRCRSASGSIQSPTSPQRSLIARYQRDPVQEQIRPTVDDRDKVVERVGRPCSPGFSY